MGNDKKWSNEYAIRTAFDDLDISEDLITDIIRERIELRNKYLKRAELKPMAKIRDDEDSHSTSRAQHMRQAAEIAKEIAHRLGLNETVAYIGMLMHDAGHSFFGHEGEHAMSVAGKLLHTGYFHHNAKGIDVILSENIINEIVEAIPGAKDDPELQERLKEDAWYFLDVVVSHDGEAASKDIIISKEEKEENITIKEKVLRKVRKANREDLYKCQPETLEAIISKPSDVIAYIKTDLLDAFSEKIITRLDDDHFEVIGAVLCETRDERDNNVEFSSSKELRAERIRKAQELVMEYRKKHLRESIEDVDPEKMEIAESIIQQAVNEGLNPFDIFVDSDMREYIKNLKKEIQKKIKGRDKEQNEDSASVLDIIKEAKDEFINRYKNIAKAEKRINEILEEKKEIYKKKRIAEGADNNTIASELDTIEEYLQKLTKERKRVVEEIMNDVQQALIDDYIETTKENWEGIENYSELKSKMNFSKGMEYILMKRLKVINYDKYVLHTKKVYQEKSVPNAVFKTIKECAVALTKTGVIRNKFYDKMVLSKIENDEVKQAMKLPEKDEKEYQEYRRKIGISKGVKLLRLKKPGKRLTYKAAKNSKTIWKNKLYKEIYSYVQRQDTRFAMNCEDVYYAIENTIRANVKDAYNPDFTPEDYLKEEQFAELKRIRKRIEEIRKTEGTLEAAKERFINEEVAKERGNFEEKVATEVVIRYLAGMTDKKIVKTLLKTGNLSWITYKKEDKINEKADNKAIKKLIEAHKGQETHKKGEEKEK